MNVALSEKDRKFREFALEGSMWKVIWKVCYPLAIYQSLNQLFKILDTMMAAHISANAVSTVAYLSQINMAISALGGGLAVGASIKISEAYGEGNFELVKRRVSTLFALCGLLGMAILAILIPVAPQFLRLANTPEEFIEEGTVYFILEPYIRIGREYALTPFPRREYREYVPQEPRRIVPRERFRIDTVSASYLASLGFSVRQAEAIVRYRDLYEGLRDEASFRACYMIADSVADLLLPYVIFPEPEPVRSGLIELNGADSATLRSVVGIGEKSVMAIIRYRERLG